MYCRFGRISIFLIETSEYVVIRLNNQIKSSWGGRCSKRPKWHQNGQISKRSIWITLALWWEEWLAELLIWEEDTDLVLTSSRKEFGFFPNKFVNRLIDAWWQKVLLKFIYSEKATKFTWLLSYVVPVRWRFCKILWPSQNIWTLLHQSCLMLHIGRVEASKG